MQVLVSSDHRVTSSPSVAERVEAIVSESVDRFANRITRVEVHLTDVNGPKHGDRDKRCVMEAHIGGVAPVAVTNEAPTVLEAIEGASTKLEHALEHALGRLGTRPKGPGEEQAATLEEITEMEKLEQARKKGKKH